MPGRPAGVRHTAECEVRYQVSTDTGGDFAARLTVVEHRRARAGDDWRMEFAFPGTQRLTERPGRSRRTAARWSCAASHDARRPAGR